MERLYYRERESLNIHPIPILQKIVSIQTRLTLLSEKKLRLSFFANKAFADEIRPKMGPELQSGQYESPAQEYSHILDNAPFPHFYRREKKILGYPNFWAHIMGVEVSG